MVDAAQIMGGMALSVGMTKGPTQYELDSVEGMAVVMPAVADGAAEGTLEGAMACVL
jgi:hypothetical protein